MVGLDPRLGPSPTRTLHSFLPLFTDLMYFFLYSVFDGHLSLPIGWSASLDFTALADLPRSLVLRWWLRQSRQPSFDASSFTASATPGQKCAVLTPHHPNFFIDPALPVFDPDQASPSRKVEALLIALDDGQFAVLLCRASVVFDLHVDW